jgi:hypothetical protein
MGYTYYRLMALIPSDIALTFLDVTNAIQHTFSHVQQVPIITADEKSCTLRWDNWTFRIHWENEPHVLEESREIAERFASELDFAHE